MDYCKYIVAVCVVTPADNLRSGNGDRKMFFHLFSCTSRFIDCDNRLIKSYTNTHYLLLFLFHHYLSETKAKREKKEEENKDDEQKSLSYKCILIILLFVFLT